MTYILTELKDNFAVLTINRPEALNAVNLELLNELAQKVRELDDNEKIHALVLRGNEKAFAAGIDLNDLYEQRKDNAEIVNLFRQAFDALDGCGKPLIAAVSGYALGIGCELACACDIILAADNARFGQPEITLGSITGFGGTQRLSKALGKAKTMEMILTGRAIGAEEAERCGLISRIVPLTDLFSEAEFIAQKISQMPSKAVLMAKDAVKFALNSHLDEGIEYEHKNCQICLNSDDFNNALQSFIEKTSSKQ